MTNLRDRKDIVRNLKRVVVKVGSRVLSNGTLRPRPHQIQKLVSELTHLTASKIECVLISSGAVLTGYDLLNIDQTSVNISIKQAAAAVGQIGLMQMYQDAFADHKLKTAQILLTRDDFHYCSRHTNAKLTLETLLSMGVVPIINENDTIATEEIRFGENDILSALVAGLVEADLLILLTDVDGYFASDPSRNGSAELIRTVELTGPPSLPSATGPASSVGSGGMFTKVQAAKTAAATGIPTIVANGLKKNILRDIMRGDELGTFFIPKNERITGKKHWMIFSSRPQGSVVVSQNAKASILDGGDLFPKEILSATGQFRAKEVVEIKSVNGHVFARGVANYGRHEVALIHGHVPGKIQSILGYKNYDEVIYRDKIVILGGDSSTVSTHSQETVTNGEHS